MFSVISTQNLSRFQYWYPLFVYRGACQEIEIGSRPQERPGGEPGLQQLRSPVTAGQDLVNFEVRRVTAYLGMMGKALLQRASESVLHAEKRRLLWGAKPFKAIGYCSSVSCSPVIPGRYRIPACQMSGTCSWVLVFRAGCPGSAGGKVAEAEANGGLC